MAPANQLRLSFAGSEDGEVEGRAPVPPMPIVFTLFAPSNFRRIDARTACFLKIET